MKLRRYQVYWKRLTDLMFDEQHQPLVMAVAGLSVVVLGGIVFWFLPTMASRRQQRQELEFRQWQALTSEDSGDDVVSESRKRSRAWDEILHKQSWPDYEIPAKYMEVIRRDWDLISADLDEEQLERLRQLLGLDEDAVQADVPEAEGKEEKEPEGEVEQDELEEPRDEVEQEQGELEEPRDEVEQ